MTGQTSWTPANYEPEDREALEEALRIQRESEVIALTGWTFYQYDQAPAGRLARMMTYITTKNAIEHEKANLENGRKSTGRTTGR